MASNYQAERSTSKVAGLAPSSVNISCLIRRMGGKSSTGLDQEHHVGAFDSRLEVETTDTLIGTFTHFIPFPFASPSPSSLTKTPIIPSPTPSFPSSSPGLTATARYFPSLLKLNALTLD